MCSGRLVRTAYLLTGDRDLAEDLLQTALTKAWFAWHRLDAPPEPYVRGVLANTYVTWWRRRWRAEPAEQPAAVADDAPGSAVAGELWAALDRLTRRQRAVVVLRYFDELSEAATADLLGCSAGTVRSLTTRALARLQVDPVRDGRPA